MIRVMSKSEDVDIGWAWVVGIAAFSSHLLTGAFCSASGVVHVALLQYYGDNMAFTALVGSVYTSLFSIMGILASILINLGSCRITHMTGGALAFIGFSSSFFVQRLDVLLLTYGVITGTGLSLCVITSYVIPGYYFRKYLGASVGISIAGAGVGILICGPVVQYFIDSYGLNGTFLLMGGISFHQILFGYLMRPSKLEYISRSKTKSNINEENKTKAWKFKQFLHISLFRNRTFLLFLVSSFLMNGAYSGIMLHLPYFAIVKGSSEHESALLLTFFGCGTLLGRILMGLILGQSGQDPLLMAVGVFGIKCFITIFFPFFSHEYTGQCIFSFLFGIYSGGYYGLLTVFMADLVGISQLSSAIGIIYFIAGIGYIIGPPIIGVILDNGGSYDSAFYAAGSCFFFAAILTLFSTIWRKGSQENTEIREKEILLQDRKSIRVLADSRILYGSGIVGGSLTLSISTELNEHDMLNEATESPSIHEANRNIVDMLQHECVKLENTHTKNIVVDEDA